MKKKFLYLPLSIILGTTLLTSCTYNYKEVDGQEITIKTADGTSKTISLKDVFDTQVDTMTAAEAYYNLLSDIYTYTAVDTTTQMENTVDQDMETNFYEAAKTNSKNNGTSVKEEQEKLLTAANVDTVEQYRDSKLLEQKKTTASDNYYSNDNMNSTSEKAGLSEQYIKENAPYHVKHILVKTGSSTDAHRGSISSTEAKNLANVLERLGALGDYDATTGITSNGESFGQVAQNKSEDTTSAARFGDLGILNISASGGDDGLSSTSFVNEFKLGLYTWDMLFNPKATENNTDENNFKVGPDTDITAYNSDGGGYSVDQYKYVLYGIPLSAAYALEYYSETEKTPLGIPVEDATETNYPRNLIYNTYFNNHSLSLLYLDATTTDELKTTLTTVYRIPEADISEYLDNYQTILTKYSTKTTLKTDGLKNSAKLYDYQWNIDNVGQVDEYTLEPITGSKNVICDEQGQPILVTRAGTGSGDSGYQGVHFIVSQYSPFEHTLAELEQYYYLDEIASKNNALWNDSETKRVDFVNYGSTKNTKQTSYNTRLSAISETIKNTNSNMTYQLYESTKAQSEAKGYTVVVPTAIQTLVNNYIEFKKVNNSLSAETTFYTAWDTYLQALEFNSSTETLTVPLTEGIEQFETGKIQKYWNSTTQEPSENPETNMLNPVYTKTN